MEGGLESKIGLKGHFTVEVIHARTGLIKQYLEFDNLITDLGLNRFGTGDALTALTDYIAVGTGLTAPANNQVLLDAELGRSNANGGFADTLAMGAGNAYGFMRRVRLFTELQVNGNLAEVGIFSSLNGGNLVNGGYLWARQRFKDNLNNDTVVVKTNQDQLRITYELRVYLPAQVNTNVLINAVNYPVSIVATNVPAAWAGSSFSIWQQSLSSLSSAAAEANGVPALTASPAGQVNNSSTVIAAYANGNFYRDASYVYEPAVANFATGVGLLWMANGFWWGAMAFNPTKIPKDNTRRLTFNVRHFFGRYP